MQDSIERLTQHAALEWHLTGNLYPSQGHNIEFAQAAIEAVNEGEPERVICHRPGPMEALPEVESWTVPVHASELIEAWRLDGFIECECGEHA